MVDGIIAGGVVLVIVVGLWLTRKTKVPPAGEAIQRAWDAEAKVGPTGEPMEWDKRDQPKDY